VLGALSDIAFRVRPKAMSLAAMASRARGLPRSAWGTAVAHAGLGVTLLGLAATGWGVERIVSVKPGETVDLGRYQVTLAGVAPRAGPNYSEVVARAEVRDGGRVVATVEPAKRFFNTRQMTVAEAGIVITAGTVSWSLGSWWQSRAVMTRSRLALARLGSVMLTLALTGVVATLAGAPLIVPYVAWFLGGAGMGIAYPTAYLVIMDGATDAGAGAAISSAEVAERLGLALGGGLGGACIALALAVHSRLTTGLTGALALSLIASIAALLLAPRLGVVGPISASGERAKAST